MFDRARRTRELLLCLLFLLFSLTFALWFVWQSGGVLSVPVWKTVDGHRYYQLLERSLLPGLPLLILAVNGCVVGLTLWGMRRRIYLAGFAACLGTLVLFSCTLQAFFSGYGKHLLTLAAGAGSFWAAFRLSRCRPTGTLPGTRLPLSRLLAGVILALCLLGPLLGTSVNGARACPSSPGSSCCLCWCGMPPAVSPAAACGRSAPFSCSVWPLSSPCVSPTTWGARPSWWC